MSISGRVHKAHSNNSELLLFLARYEHFLLKHKKLKCCLVAILFKVILLFSVDCKSSGSILPCRWLEQCVENKLWRSHRACEMEVETEFRSNISHDVYLSLFAKLLSDDGRWCYSVSWLHGEVIKSKILTTKLLDSFFIKCAHTSFFCRRKNVYIPAWALSTFQHEHSSQVFAFVHTVCFFFILLTRETVLEAYTVRVPHSHFSKSFVRLLQFFRFNCLKRVCVKND